jgi:hypothetical protein
MTNFYSTRTFSVPITRADWLDKLGDWFVPEPNTGCWLWMRSVKNSGYGQYRIGSRVFLAHRLLYEALIGPIPNGLTIDHLCRTKSCVNPAHMDPVTMGVNALRGDSPPSRNAHKTHCLRGHEFTPDNTAKWRTKRNGRRCRECNRLYGKVAWLRRKATMFLTYVQQEK